MTHVMVWRGMGQEDGVAGFWHHGVLLSDDSIVHYSGMNGMKTLQNAVIQRTAMSEFAPDPARRVHVVVHPREISYSVAVVEQRALAQVGTAGYDLVARNCETFARWCVTGERESRQVQGAIAGACAGVASLIMGGGIPGALVFAFAAAKMWDHGGNRSVSRRRADDEESVDA